MIALNELLENLDEFTYKYKEKGVRFDPNFFVTESEKLKNLQLIVENDRASCNKMCALLTQERLENKNTEPLLQEILKLDKKICANSKKLTKQIRKINNKLKKLHNLPVYTNQFNEQIECAKKEMSKDEFLNLIESQIKFARTKMKYEKYMKLESGKLYEESELPKAIMCKNKLVFSCTLDSLAKIKSTLLEYLKSNSFSIIKVSVRKLKKDNAEEYFVHLARNAEIGIYFVTDYHTRNYKLKYKDTKSDMSRFVQQLIITF